MKLIKACAAVVLLSIIFIQQAAAAPFAKTVEFTQPNGQKIELWGEGDDFHAVFETLDGYTVYFDKAAKAYFYAELNADGTDLVSTGVMVGEPRPAGPQPHVRIDQASAIQKAKALQQIWEEQTGIPDRWNSLKLERRTLEQDLQYGPITMAPPDHTTLGEITGIVLLIDFDDAERTIPREEIDNYCNQPGYSGYGNNGSVRDYYQDVSNGMLLYTNVITAYVRIPNTLHPKSYYTNPARDAGESANELIHDALDILTAQPNYASEIAPMLDLASIDNNGRALALNVFYAGGNGGVWAQGLWPHMWGLSAEGAYQLTARTTVFTYQITNMGDGLTIGTFCHENGHMICGYPDLYDYEYDSVGGAGQFCLMGSGGHGTNPAQICAYLKYASGWTTTLDVDPTAFLEASVSGVLGEEEFNRVYKVTKPNTETEYYLFEGRRRQERDLSLPAEGVFIWHVDELGNRDDQRTGYNDAHENYECSLVQADNKFDFQNYGNSGDPNDSWYEGNTSAGYENKFTDKTAPSSRWWSGQNSAIRTGGFSAISNVMTFVFLPPVPTLLSTSGALPDGREWARYNYSIGVYGGYTNLLWTITSGDLPDGLAMDDLGVISGYPTLQGTYSFNIRCENDYGDYAAASFSITILPVHGVPFFEGFDESEPPDSWTQEHRGVSNFVSWTIQSENVLSPQYAYSLPNMSVLFSSTTNATTTVLVTPRIDFGEEGRAGVLSFRHYMRNTTSGSDELHVYYKTVMTNEWTLLQSYLAPTERWEYREIALTNISRQVYVAFAGISRSGYGICVDSVNVWDPTPEYAFVSDELPNAIIDEYYEEPIVVEGGYEPYTFAVVSNSLPVGMQLSADGVIYGTATAVQIVKPVIEVTDDRGNKLSKTFSLLVTEPVVNLFEEGFEYHGLLPPGWTQELVDYNTWWTTRGGGYQAHPFQAHEGGYNAYMFALDFNSMTAGYNTHVTRMVTPELDLSQTTSGLKLYFWHCMEQFSESQDTLKILYKTSLEGEWSEIAEFAANTPDWRQRVVDLPHPSATYYIAFEGYARFGYGICIDSVRITNENSAPVITSDDSLPNGLKNVPYEYTLSAAGGIEPYTWELVGGTLPLGMSVSTNGMLNGTPFDTYLNDFYVSVTGDDGNASTNRFSLRVRGNGGIPFFEDFEEGGAMPENWMMEAVRGTVQWEISKGTACDESTRQPTVAYSGEWNASMHDGYSTRGEITKLVTPMIDMSSVVSNAVLTFRHHMQQWYSQDYLRVFYRNTPDAEWIPLALYTLNTSEWTERSIALPNTSGTYFIAFEGHAQQGYGISIDDVSINGAVDDPYHNWLMNYFPPDAVSIGNGTGYFDDPDGDDIDNIWEYAHFLNPRVFNATGTSTGGVFDAHLNLMYRQNKGATDLSFVVEACDDLVVADWSTNGVNEVLRTDMGDWWDVTTWHDVPVTNAPTRFMRLKLLID